MDTTTQTTSPATPSPVRTDAQNARSSALDRSQALALDLGRQLRAACIADVAKPFGQKDRAELKKLVEAKLAEINRLLARIME